MRVAVRFLPVAKLGRWQDVSEKRQVSAGNHAGLVEIPYLLIFSISLVRRMLKLGWSKSRTY
jgi:hypothetical protein